MAEQENKTFMKAILRSSKQPTEQQLQKLQQFLQQKHNATVELSFLQDDTVRGGFKIELGANSTKFSPEFVYDWSLAGKAEQLKEKIAAVIKNKADVMPLIRQTVADFAPTPQASEVGSVLTVGDGIATVSGLDHAEYGEILVFSGGIKGMILDLKEQTGKLAAYCLGTRPKFARAARFTAPVRLPVFRLARPLLAAW